MNYSCFVPLLLVFAAGAHAENWVKTYANDIAVEYVDTDSIRKTDTAVSASFKRDYLDGVERRAEVAPGKFFVFARSRSVVSFECAGNRHVIDQVWEVSADGKIRSPARTYPPSQNNETWDAAAKRALCR